MNNKETINIRGKILQNESLAKYTWLKVGGIASRIFFPEDVADLQQFMLKNNKQQYFVLGGGSNVLIRDGGYSGTVIKLDAPEFKQIKISDTEVICGAGVLNFRLKNQLVKSGIGGLEFLCSIPGTVGGAVAGNAGCFGREMSDVIKWVEIMLADGDIIVLNSSDLEFSYRHTSLPRGCIVLSVGLRGMLADAKDIEQEINRQAEYRRIHQPQGILTAGSTFKNPQGYKAWELIKNSGADKIIIGGAKMSPLHCNFLQNDGEATAADIETLGEKIIYEVEKHSGIRLQWEIKIIGNK